MVSKFQRYIMVCVICLLVISLLSIIPTVYHEVSYTYWYMAYKDAVNSSNWEDEVISLKKMNEITPTRNLKISLAGTYSVKAIELVKSGKGKEGFQLFELAITMEPSYPATYETYAQMLVEKGYWHRAHFMMERAEQLSIRSGTVMEQYYDLNSDIYKKVIVKASDRGDVLTAAINYRKLQLSSKASRIRWSDLTGQQRVVEFFSYINQEPIKYEGVTDALQGFLSGKETN